MEFGARIARARPHRTELSIRRISDRALIGACILIVALLCALTVAANAAQARHVHWHKAGASVYGGAGDSGCYGYRGDRLCDPNGLWRSFAELGMGCNRPGDHGLLGNLPVHARIRVLYRHRRVTLTKRDCGLGGPPVGGFPRAIDLWWRAAAYLHVDGLAVVQWRRLE